MTSTDKAVEMPTVEDAAQTRIKALEAKVEHLTKEVERREKTIADQRLDLARTKEHLNLSDRNVQRLDETLKKRADDTQALFKANQRLASMAEVKKQLEIDLETYRKHDQALKIDTLQTTNKALLQELETLKRDFTTLAENAAALETMIRLASAAGRKVEEDAKKEAARQEAAKKATARPKLVEEKKAPARPKLAE